MADNNLPCSSQRILPFQIRSRFTSKGSFRFRKKIVKVSISGVAVWGSRGVGELQCRGVAVWESCDVGELWCGRVAVWGTCGVGESWYRVAML